MAAPVIDHNLLTLDYWQDSVCTPVLDLKNLR
mgnify:CR=1 FL=1